MSGFDAGGKEAMRVPGFDHDYTLICGLAITRSSASRAPLGFGRRGFSKTN